MALPQEPELSGDVTGVGPKLPNMEANEVAAGSGNDSTGQHEESSGSSDYHPPLAAYRKHGMHFDVKLSSTEMTWYQGERVHILHLTLNFAKPLSPARRFVGATVRVSLYQDSEGSVHPPTGTGPRIHRIKPTVDLVQVSMRETESQRGFTAGISGDGGPVNLSLTGETTQTKRTTFRGIRLIHGVIEDEHHAHWRLYEEPGSESGIPQVVRLLLVVGGCAPSSPFSIQAEAAARSPRHASGLWLRRTFRAQTHTVKVLSLDQIAKSVELGEKKRLEAVVAVMGDMEKLWRGRTKLSFPRDELLKLNQEIDGFTKALPYWEDGLAAGRDGDMTKMRAWLAKEVERQLEEENRERLKNEQEAQREAEEVELEEEKLRKQKKQDELERLEREQEEEWAKEIENKKQLRNLLLQVQMEELKQRLKTLQSADPGKPFDSSLLGLGLLGRGHFRQAESSSSIASEAAEHHRGRRRYPYSDASSDNEVYVRLDDPRPSFGPRPPGGFDPRPSFGPRPPGGFDPRRGFGPRPAGGFDPRRGFGPRPGFGHRERLVQPDTTFALRMGLRDSDLDGFSPVGPGYKVLSLD